MADAHIQVVGHYAQVVRRATVGAQQHKIFQLAVSKLYAAEHGVVEGSNAGIRNGEAHGCGFSGSTPARTFLPGNFPASSFIARWAPFSSRRSTALLHFLFSTETIVSMSGG